MSDTTAQAVEKAEQTVIAYNEDRRREKLVRKIQRSHEWRVQVWAQMEMKIRASQAALIANGGEEVDLFEPDFVNEESLNQYASMTLTK